VVGDTPGDASERFWNQQDVPVILQKWAKGVPWDRFHLVTVPPAGSDPEVLWDRFCSVLSLDGTAFEQPPRTNESIGVVSASLMHRINLAAIAEGVERIDYQRMLHRRFADTILAPRRDQEASIAVSPEVDQWIRSRAMREVEDLRKLGLHVVGDLDDLLPGAALDGREPPDVSDSELLDVSVEAIVKLAVAQDDVIGKLREQNKALRKRVAGTPAGEPAVSPERPRTAKKRVADLSRKARRLARRGRSKVAKVVHRHGGASR